MIQVTPQMRVLVAVEPADFRKGIDGLARLCRVELQSDPMSGAAFVFRNRRKTALRILVYDGQGFCLFYKRLSTGRFRYWPGSVDEKLTSLQAHELQVLLFGGDPKSTKVAPLWRQVVM
jgi:transposase